MSSATNSIPPHAFHSGMMDPILDVFREQVRRVALSPPNPLSFERNRHMDYGCRSYERRLLGPTFAPHGQVFRLPNGIIRRRAAFL